MFPRQTLGSLTYDDFTGFDRLGDLVGTSHLRVAHPSHDEDNETGAGPAVILRARLVFLPSTVDVKLKVFVQIQRVALQKKNKKNTQKTM